MDSDKVLELVNIVQREVEDYARGGIYKAITYPISDTARQHYAVLVIPDRDYPVKARPGIVVAARIMGDHVIIDEDITDRPLWEELVRAGIPREQIVCAYAGETPPNEGKAGEDV